MGPTGYPESSVTNYKLRLRNVPEKRKPYSVVSAFYKISDITTSLFSAFSLSVVCTCVRVSFCCVAVPVSLNISFVLLYCYSLLLQSHCHFHVSPLLHTLVSESVT